MAVMEYFLDNVPAPPQSLANAAFIKYHRKQDSTEPSRKMWILLLSQQIITSDQLSQMCHQEKYSEIVAEVQQMKKKSATSASLLTKRSAEEAELEMNS